MPAGRHALTDSSRPQVKLAHKRVGHRAFLLVFLGVAVFLGLVVAVALVVAFRFLQITLIP